MTTGDRPFITLNVAKTFIRPAEAARRIGASAVTIRRWFHQGVLPGRRLGGRIEIDEQAVLAIEAGADFPLDPEVEEGERSEPLATREGGTPCE